MSPRIWMVLAFSSGCFWAVQLLGIVLWGWSLDPFWTAIAAFGSMLHGFERAGIEARGGLDRLVDIAEGRRSP